MEQRKRKDLSKLTPEEKKEHIRKLALERVKKYNAANKEIIKERKRVFNANQENRDKINKTRRLYVEKNRNKYNEKNREYHRERWKKDILFKLKTNIRNSINASFRAKDKTKTNKTVLVLGCSITDFKIYIESKFEAWMNWDNHGLYNGESNYGWDIDHITPVSSARNEEELIQLNHYTNFQPLCSKINRVVKRAKIV